MNLLPFMSGAVTMGFAISSLFLLRFWRTTKDRLFLSFAIAFLFLGVAQAMLVFSQSGSDDRSWIYLIRFFAFALICAAILRKNVKETTIK